jgi:hypothetical protein
LLLTYWRIADNIPVEHENRIASNPGNAGKERKMKMMSSDTIIAGLPRWTQGEGWAYEDIGDSGPYASEADAMASLEATRSAYPSIDRTESHLQAEAVERADGWWLTGVMLYVIE